VDPESLDFDPVLLSRVRLGVISVLVSREEATFPELKSLLGVTQGNLTIHLRKLEEAGYVTIDKSFVDKKPRTSVSLAPAGRKAFLSHVEALGQIAGEGDRE
jgi:DNA-binding MarR family transcriptional regulator